ncbi:hypothetical protein ACP275_08G159200 [Erythranthe tilingii]
MNNKKKKMGLIKCEWILLITVAVLLLAPYSSDSFPVTAANEKRQEDMIQRWAEFAVKQYNKQSGTDLKLRKIEKAKKVHLQWMVNIYFTLLAKGSGQNSVMHKYKALVTKAALVDGLQLKYFKITIFS